MQTTAETMSKPAGAPLRQQVAEAMGDRTLPISRLLRLMWALEAEADPSSDHLRAQLRTRIGAPLAN